MGIGLIRPMAEAFSFTQPSRRYLLITRHLNNNILHALGNTFQIAHLSYSENELVHLIFRSPVQPENY